MSSLNTIDINIFQFINLWNKIIAVHRKCCLELTPGEIRKRSCNNMRGGQPNLLLSMAVRVSNSPSFNSSDNYFYQRMCSVWCVIQWYITGSRERTTMKDLQAVYILLEIRRYLVWRPWAIIAPLFFFLKSTLADPTALPARRTLASISISSWMNGNRKLRKTGKSNVVYDSVIFTCTMEHPHIYTAAMMNGINTTYQHWDFPYSIILF
jgi:hypothetical protein